MVQGSVQNSANVRRRACLRLLVATPLAPGLASGLSTRLSTGLTAGLAAGLSAGLSAALSGCFSTGPARPKTLSVEVQAAANLNPDARGRPSPVVVRLYELKASSGFEAADFSSLYEKDQSALAADLVAREEWVLRPGENKSVKRPGADARFLAAFAAFRDLERARWRAVLPLVAGSDNAFVLRLEASTLTLLKR